MILTDYQREDDLDIYWSSSATRENRRAHLLESPLISALAVSRVCPQILAATGCLLGTQSQSWHERTESNFGEGNIVQE